MFRGQPVAIKTHVAEKRVSSAISDEDMEIELMKALKEFSSEARIMASVSRASF